MILSLLPQPALAADLQLRVDGLRNTRGLVRLCLTRDPAHFPDCASDPQAVRLNVPAARASRLALPVDPGQWALSVIHDENGNGRLDRSLGIPREGFGFSRNPKIRFGPPRFDETRFDLPGTGGSMAVRVRYLL